MATTTLTVNIPKKYSTKFDNQDFERYLTDSILDYIEVKEDLELKQELKSDKKFKSLNKKLDKVLWDL